MTLPDTAVLQTVLGYQFTRPELLARALTHTSHAREAEAAHASSAEAPGANNENDNEQLEFLGDAVLGLLTAEALYRRFPHFREGKLSKLRAHLVSEKHLIRVAQELNLGDFLRLGRGEEKSGGRSRTAMLVDALEAVLAAMYLDGGLEAVREFVSGHIVSPELGRLASDGETMPLTDYKSALQEKLQAHAGLQPSYVLVKQRGPEHRKTFTVEVRLRASNGSPEFVGRAEGPTKKSAEQDAARQVLEHLDSIGQPESAGEPKPRV
jgi:ribonuclease-3